MASWGQEDWEKDLLDLSYGVRQGQQNEFKKRGRLTFRGNPTTVQLRGMESREGKSFFRVKAPKGGGVTEKHGRKEEKGERKTSQRRLEEREGPPEKIIPRGVSFSWERGTS